ncbi:MAG: acetyl-CoA carboxylase biotin carboxylase subunit [Ignavibacteriae bacterium]|nr:acetyl-CoA carboxylase biotin carboxylase subunit [Ignavibacteriota bacterium]
MFNKILIANRGEVALRIIRTCKEMGIKTVAVYSTADRNSLHVRFADEAVCIGPASASQSYLNIPRIISAGEITNADAIHPGYGFLAENAEFAEICNDSNMIFIGPTPEMMSRMGDKAVAKELMKKIGVPVVEGSEGKFTEYEEAKEIASKIGYPIILKASAGGGGKGMRIVREESHLEAALDITKAEALSAFGVDSMYLEKLIENPHHVEFQIIGDKFGNIVHAGERDCTIQRRHQKLIEECPSPYLDEDLRERMAQAAINAAKSVNYESLGTVEFLVDKDKNFYFMEMNTRMQVEHPITEAVVNIDLIKEQICIAAGEKISRKKFKFFGHSIECRINAEDTELNFKPCPGLITAFNAPGGNGVRVDTHCYAGYHIPSNYDSMIGKLIVIGVTREEAIKRMLRALDEFIVEGVKTTIPLFQKILTDKNFVAYNYDTNYLEKREEIEV